MSLVTRAASSFHAAVHDARALRLARAANKQHHTSLKDKQVDVPAYELGRSLHLASATALRNALDLHNSVLVTIRSPYQNGPGHPSYCEINHLPPQERVRHHPEQVQSGLWCFQGLRVEEIDNMLECMTGMS